MGREWSRIFLKPFLDLFKPSETLPGPQNWILNFSTPPKVYGSSITHLLGRYFPKPSHNSCSYEPYGPFGLSVKILSCNVKRCPYRENGGYPHFSPNSFSYRGSGGVANTGLGPNRENSWKPRTTFVRRRGTWCMSPSPLCGESTRSHHF